MQNDDRKKTVALLAGGYSLERDVAIVSGKHIDQLFKEDQRYQTFLIQVGPNGWHYEDPANDQQRFQIDRNDFSLTLANKQTIKFDLAVLLMGGAPGEDGQVQGYLQLAKVPFVGCGILASAVTFNKSIANRIVRSFNSSFIHVSPSIDVFRSVLVDGSTEFPLPNISDLRLPVIVKPTDTGSSLGVSKVLDVSQLANALTIAFAESNHVLVEQFITGREITVGVARIQGQIRVLPITEIIFGEKFAFFDIQAKFEGDPEMKVITPADLSEVTKKRVETGVSELYEKLNLSGIVRIDLMLEHPDDKIFFLEVNSAPSQTEWSVVVQQLAKAGWNGPNLVEFYKQLFDEAL